MLTRTREAERLRRLADGMQNTVDGKLAPAVATQRVTARRARMSDRIIADGRRLQRVQLALRALADAHDEGTLPEGLRGLRTKTTVEEVLLYTQWPGSQWDEERRTRFVKEGITATSYPEVRAALLDMTPENGPTPTQARILELKRGLYGSKIPGYFPTPACVVARMLELVTVTPNYILEPSAGKGDIADAARARWPEAGIDTFEISADLREILKLKKYPVLRTELPSTGGYTHSFTDYILPSFMVGYELILMNPPFEHFQDIQHVLHAYKMLAPGGELIAIMSESTFFRTEGIASNFRLWLDRQDSYVEKVEPGAFFASDRPTGVNCRIVAINKLEGGPV